MTSRRDAAREKRHEQGHRNASEMTRERGSGTVRQDECTG